MGPGPPRPETPAWAGWAAGCHEDQGRALGVLTRQHAGAQETPRDAFVKPRVSKAMAPFCVGQTPVTRYLSVTVEAGGGPVAGPGFSVGAPLCERWSGFSPV